ncbi:MAG: hypothetical protein LBO09_05300 [Candidatus Peribacteria bacterium]|jgi:hypothetical protein|nr:hypothetical protein [Candidatus Peribacteria bacterium]
MEEATKYPTGTSPETTESINEVKLSDSPDTITADILFAIKDNDPEIETLVGRLISINSNDDEIDTFTKNVIIEAVKKHIKLIIKYESDNEN